MTEARRLSIATDGFRGGDTAGPVVQVFGDLVLALDPPQDAPLDVAPIGAILEGAYAVPVQGAIALCQDDGIGIDQKDIDMILEACPSG